MIERLRLHWDQLQARERRVLAAGAAAVLVMAVYVLAWEPLVDGRARLQGEVTEQRALLAWMEQSAREVQALRGSRTPQRNSGQSLMAVVDRTARAQGLGTALERVQPDGERAVRVWLKQAPFDQSLRWLDQLITAQGLRVTGLVVERGSEAGKVDARITLEAGA
jgi:general secretion pathway protein M